MNRKVPANRFGRERRHPQKRSARHGAMSLLVLPCTVLCCCAAALFVGLPDEELSFPSSAPPSSRVAVGNTRNTDVRSELLAGGQIDVDETAWCLVLVNKWNAIPTGHDVRLQELANGQSIDRRIYPALQEMLDAARSEGVYPVVVSGYRTAKEQQQLLDDKVAELRGAGCSAKEAAAKAGEWVAVPGTSEHQLGIAVDINADGVLSAGREVYEWLDKNACKYGFIYRYPPNKTEITGVMNEPWHYRYVGIDAATEMRDRGICLEEYLNATHGAFEMEKN